MSLVLLFVLLCCGSPEASAAGFPVDEIRAIARPGDTAKALRNAAGADFERDLGSALRRLLERPHGFVVIEHSKSGKFVQFANSAEQGLLFDVPHQILSTDEFVRAEGFFADRGIDASYESPLLDPQTRQQVGIQRSFQVLLGSDTQTGATMAAEFLVQVYGIKSDSALRFVEE